MYPSSENAPTAQKVPTRKNSIIETVSLWTILKEEWVGFCTIFIVGTCCMAIVSFAFAMFILGDPLTCGKAPPAPPDNGILTWNETEVVKTGTRAIYDCLPGYRSITIKIIHV